MQIQNLIVRPVRDIAGKGGVCGSNTCSSSWVELAELAFIQLNSAASWIDLEIQ